MATLKDLLDAPDEASAVVLAETTESQLDPMVGDDEDITSRGGDNTSPQGDMSNDEVALEMLGLLSEEDRVVVNRFRNVDWLKIVHGIKCNPQAPWEMVARQVGEALMAKIEEAGKSQYDTKGLEAARETSPQTKMTCRAKLAELSKYTPLRLVWAEREILRLLESTLYISDYTDNVDILHSGNKNRQIVKQIRQICSILTGLIIARDYEEGQRLIKDRDFKSLAMFFQACFEIGRRYKVLNPEKMRDSYGKLMYFLMDSRSTTVMNLLEFDCVTPIKTVYDLLARKTRGLDLLSDPLLVVATQEIYVDKQDRSSIAMLQHRKDSAAKELIEKYGQGKSTSAQGKHAKKGLFQQLRYSLWYNVDNDEEAHAPLDVPREKEWESDVLSEEDVELAVYSLKDHMTFLRYNEKPVDIMYRYLTALFDVETPEDEFRLDIQAGRGGARLSHGHQRQYQYVRQSLLLWREVLRNFLKLWSLADSDMLSERHPYKLRETGQGLNRIQQSPEVYRVMNDIIGSVQREAGGWIGSSMVHLGDHNVPNALMFIDKYTQVPRIVGPIVSVLEQIEPLCRSNREIGEMIVKYYGSPLRLQKTILADFFRHAFDGSGADNFFDAGSCIDGRLTSAWNWCNNLEKKKFYPIFLLCGFSGFDGKF